jgi:hypothetical protein
VYLSENNRNKGGAPKKLDWLDKMNILGFYETDPKKYSYSKLAAMYKVSKGTISNVINGRYS